MKSEFNTNDVVFLPQGYPHYFKNTSTEKDMVLLLTFENFNFNIIPVAGIIQQLPEVVDSALNTSISNAGHEPLIKYKF